jgi:hypothetical protein
MHPLVPREGFTLHVEGSNVQSLIFRSTVELKKLVDFKDQTKSIVAIETRNLKLNGRTGEPMRWWWWLVKSRRRNTVLEMSNFCVDGGEIVTEVLLSGDDLV